MISHMDGTPETVNNAPLPCQDQLPSQKDLIRSVGDSQASSSINGVAVGADDYPASEVELRTRSHSPAMVQPQRQHERTSSSASSPAMVRQFPSTSSFASSVDTLMASGFHIGGGSVTPTGPLPTAGMYIVSLPCSGDMKCTRLTNTSNDT